MSCIRFRLAERIAEMGCQRAEGIFKKTQNLLFLIPQNFDILKKN